MTAQSSWKTGLCGLSVATLVFLPTLNVLSSGGAYWLHWRTQDTVETVLAWLGIGACVAALLQSATWAGLHGVRVLLEVAGLAVGLFFAAGAVVRLDGLYQLIAAHRTLAPGVGVLLAAAGLGLTSWAVWRCRSDRVDRVERVLLALSPIGAVLLLNLGSAEVHQQRPPVRSETPHATSASSIDRPLHVILLFDELSPEILDGAVRDEPARFPAFARMMASSTVYTGAYLPGGHTGAAVPSLFGSAAGVPLSAPDAERVRHALLAQDGGMVALARGRGLDTRVFGWYVDYCSGIAAAADVCSAVSVYNPRTLGSDFSLLHPLWTSVNLLPFDWPFGLLKVTAATRFHERTLEVAGRWLERQLEDPHADVVFVHVGVPHVPFLDERLADDSSRFVVTRERYLRQLEVADRFLSAADSAVARHVSPRRPVTLVLLSDHNSRALTPVSRHEQVVFLRRTGEGVAHRHEEGARIQAGELLWRSIRGAIPCATGPRP